MSDEILVGLVVVVVIPVCFILLTIALCGHDLEDDSVKDISVPPDY